MTAHSSKTVQKLMELQIANLPLDSQQLDTLKEAILADGKLDAEKIGIIEKVIFSNNNKGGCALNREKVEFLFAINNISDNNRDDKLWQTLFVEAVTAHILNDKESPGVVDEEEALWLINTIEADGGYNINEVALLKNLMESADELPSNIKFRLDMILAAI
ncbi:MAG: hypothetical protein HQL69_20700 [Magnetococcales bacterium]|nr:hypothetical protein [Magnetococcales bacterium]